MLGGVDQCAFSGPRLIGASSDFCPCRLVETLEIIVAGFNTGAVHGFIGTNDFDVDAADACAGGGEAPGVARDGDGVDAVGDNDVTEAEIVFCDTHSGAIACVNGVGDLEHRGLDRVFDGVDAQMHSAQAETEFAGDGGFAGARET